MKYLPDTIYNDILCRATARDNCFDYEQYAVYGVSLVISPGNPIVRLAADVSACCPSAAIHRPIPLTLLSTGFASLLMMWDNAMCNGEITP